jgi:phosphatidate cytidylyltransferase
MRTRIISAVVGAPLLLAVVLWPSGGWPFPGWPFALLTLALILVGLHEFYAGCRQAGRHPLDGFGYAAGLLFWLLATPMVRDPEAHTLRFALTALVLLSLVTEALRPHSAPLQNLAPTWLGVVYIAWLFPFALRLRLGEELVASQIEWYLPAEWMRSIDRGAWLMLFTMLVTSSVDTGAYFVGKSFGKHKLAPAVSPGKTWEGAVGGFLTALVVAGLTAGWLRLPMSFALSAGAIIGVVSQLGDLSKSAVKREIGIKDFGKLIPGHGGVLDRFDSLLFTAPSVYWLLFLWRGS